jgi:hypothetical protein
MAKNRPYRWLKGFGFVFLALAAGAAFAAWETARRYHADYDVAIADARRVGVPLDLEAVIPEPIPDDQNAALIYNQAAALLDGPLKADQHFLTEISARKNLSTKEQGAEDTTIERLEPALKLVEDCTRPRCQFERDWSAAPNVRFPEIITMKTLAKDLCLQADMRDRRGESKGALESLQAALKVARGSGSDPVLISLLVSEAMRAIVSAELKNLISRDCRNDQTLDRLGRLLVAHMDLPDPRFFFGGEPVFGLMAARDMNVFQEQDSLADDSPDTSGSQDRPPTVSEKIRNGFPGVREEVESKVIETWVVAWSRFPSAAGDWHTTDEALRAATDFVSRDHSVFNLGASESIADLSAIGNLVLRRLATDRILLCSIAVLEARNRTGHFPAALPASLGEESVDPFGGKPLAYAPSDPGFSIASVWRSHPEDPVSATDTRKSFVFTLPK